MEENLLLIFVLLAQALLIGFKFLERLSHKKNGKPSTSNGKITSLCMNHEGRISSLETDSNNKDKAIEALRKENREDHGKIFEKLDALAK